MCVCVCVCVYEFVLGNGKTWDHETYTVRKPFADSFSKMFIFFSDVIYVRQTGRKHDFMHVKIFLNRSGRTGNMTGWDAGDEGSTPAASIFAFPTYTNDTNHFEVVLSTYGTCIRRVCVDVQHNVIDGV